MSVEWYILTLLSERESEREMYTDCILYIIYVDIFVVCICFRLEYICIYT